MGDSWALFLLKNKLWIVFLRKGDAISGRSYDFRDMSLLLIA
jgi:hypothetical protein